MSHTCLFLPDISGFTQFVKATEIEHSQHIISELLELLIDQNHLGLELAEIEGDALFFYKKEQLPGIDEIRNQVQRMYIAFHRHLSMYETHRICHCGACSTASSLQLKFFVHCGETKFIKVKNSVKPFGEAVIEAHRLMKNSVPLKEYILFSDDFLTAQESREGPDMAAGSDIYDGTALAYSFQDIGEWKPDQPMVPAVGIGDAPALMWTTEFEVNLPRESFFELLTNFRYRHLWVEADQIEYNENQMNRAGVRHVCVYPNGSQTFETIKRDFEDTSWVTGERMTFLPGYKYAELYYLVYSVENDRTKVEVRLYGKPGPLAFLLKPIVLMRSKKELLQMFSRLKALAERSPPLVPAES